MKKTYFASFIAVIELCIAALILYYSINKNNIPPSNASDNTESSADATEYFADFQSDTISADFQNSTASADSQSRTTAYSQNKTTSANSQSSSSLPNSSSHRFVFITDSRGDDNGVNKTALTKILQLIKGLTPQPEYIITGGDLVSGADSDSKFLSQLQNYKNIFTTYYPINMLLPGFGNHEVGDSHDKLFQDFFKGFPKTTSVPGYDNTAYYLDVGNIRLIMLNSDYQNQIHEISDGQLDWLNTCTQKGNQMIKFVFEHEPPYPTGANIGFSLDVHPTQRNSFWKVIDSNNVMALFCAHEHNYSRRCIDGGFNSQFKRAVYQITAGTAGAPVHTQYTSKKGVVVPPDPVYHFVIIDVGQSTTTITAISIYSKVIDQFTLQNID